MRIPLPIRSEVLREKAEKELKEMADIFLRTIDVLEKVGNEDELDNLYDMATLSDMDGVALWYDRVDRQLAKEKRRESPERAPVP